jgi:hypothetical protein
VGLLLDRGQQRGPVRAERARTLALQVFGEGVGVDSGVRYRGDGPLRGCVVGLQPLVGVSMVSEGEQGFSGTVSIVFGAASPPTPVGWREK